MPLDAPASKLAATRGYGAEVVLYDRYKENRAEVGERLQKERGALLVPPFDDELIMAGQGTAALELLEDVPDLDVLVVPVSGGGLMAGSALAARHLRPSIVLYGVEPEAGSDTAQSLAQGRARVDRDPQDDRRRAPGGAARGADFPDPAENPEGGSARIRTRS